jgi:hypothetical protein
LLRAQQNLHPLAFYTKKVTSPDFTVKARAVVEQAIGEPLDGTPLPKQEKNPHAVALGRLGGKKGGKARAKPHDFNPWARKRENTLSNLLVNQQCKPVAEKETDKRRNKPHQ